MAQMPLLVVQGRPPLSLLKTAGKAQFLEIAELSDG